MSKSKVIELAGRDENRDPLTDMLHMMFKLGMCAQSEFESTKACAEAGDASAQYELGYMFHISAVRQFHQHSFITS
jgi:Tfp pilus assembly protein PilN